MNIILPERFVKPDPSRPVTASLPERRNEGTDGVLGAGDGDYLILARHWPNFPVPLRREAA